MTYQNWTYELEIDRNFNDWQFIEPIHTETNIKLVKEPNEIFARFSVDKLVVNNETDISILNALASDETSTFLRIYLNDTLQVTCVLDLRADVDEDRGIYTYPLEIFDSYSLVIEGYDKEVNVLSGNVDLEGLIANNNNLPLTFKTGTNFATGPGSLWSTFSGVNIYARQEQTVSNYEADILLNNGWTQIGSTPTTKDLARDWTASPWASPTPGTDYGIYQQFTGSQGRTINTLYMNDSITHIFEQMPATLWNQIGVYNDVYYPLSYTHSRCFNLIEVIKDVVNDIDPSMNFNESGGLLDSFYYLKTFTDSDTNKPLSEIYISQITDFILNSDGTEKSNPATVGNLTFRKITDYLKQKFSIFWEIEDQSGSDVIVFKHYTETTKSVSRNPDLTDYFNINWTERKSQYEYIRDKFFKRLKRQETAGNDDFIGLDVITNDLETESVIDITYSVFFVDVWDTYVNSGTYPDSSTNQFMMLSTSDSQDPSDYFDNSINFINSGLPAGFETFSWTATTRTMAAINLVGNNGVAIQDALTPFDFRTGDIVEVNCTLTMNSGTNPELLIDGVTYPLSTGVNQVICDPIDESPGTLITVQANGATATDFSLQFTSLYVSRRKVLESTGAISGNTVTNAGLSLANADDDHLSELPTADLNVNGSDITLASNRLDKIRTITDIKTPLSDFGVWFFDDLVVTDLANAELESIEQKNDNSLANVKLIF